MSTAEPTPSPAGTTLVGQVVSGRYRIKELIGEGGMGAVYLAEHTHMRKRVALKLLHPEMSRDDEVLARFKREAEAAAHVEHPNVAAATDFGQTEDGAFFLVLEYVEGKSLRSAIESGPLHTRRALYIARQMGSALERAHAAGIVHRDLKPENVMLVDKPEDPDFVKVLDFGIAKVEPHPSRDTTQPLTRFGTILGTPEYMAPEQALGETVGPAADLYAVGVMLYEMLTGRHPFAADDRMAMLSMHIVAPVPKMADRNAAVDVPAPVEALTMRLLEKDAKARPANARALIEAVDLAAGQSGIELPARLSSRSFGRESNPGPAPSSVPEIPPQAVHTPPDAWTSKDALAKTDYGLPASTASLPKVDGAASRASGVQAALEELGERLKKLPRVAMFAVAGTVPLVVILLIVVVLLARRSPSDVAETGDAAATTSGGGSKAAARPAHASPEKIKAAAIQGIPSLEVLATEFPEDTAVQKQIVLSLGEMGRTNDALRALRVLARKNKEIVDEPLLQLVVTAAQRQESAEEAFSLLEGPLGARGVDGLIELSTSKSTSPAVRTRATKSLAKTDVRANASAASGVIIDLKTAKDCPAKRDVLDRVKDNGDERILPTLKAMKNPRGCGFMGMRDCYGCLRRDDTLEDAIKAVEDRGSK
jgi:eukaryotic-like serine/threonine-protein kinase